MQWRRLSLFSAFAFALLVSIFAEMPSEMETLILIKPDAVERGLIGEIIRRFESRTFAITRLHLVTPSQEQIELHYAEHKGKSFYNALISRLQGKRLVAMTVRGQDAVPVVRSMVGATSPMDALPGTIRGDYGLYLEANVIHASDSKDSAHREIHLWFPDGK